MPRRKKIKFEEVFPEGVDNISITKDCTTFGGSNMWHLNIRRADGCWERGIQWLGVYMAERIVGKTLTKYEEPKTQYD